MNIFDYVKDKVSFKEIFEAYDVPYEEYGDETLHYFKAKCPFDGCNDKKKSFAASVKKKLFYCFKCHNCGDVTNLIAKLHNISDIDAIKKLISRYHDWQTKEPLRIPKEYEKESRKLLGDHFVDSYVAH